MGEVWTVLKLLRWTADYFTARGIDSPRLDAELLLADTLKLDRVGLYLNFERPLQTDELSAYRDRVRRRAGRAADLSQRGPDRKEDRTGF